MRTPPGWYRDPTNPAIERWWGGTSWSNATRPAQPSTASRRGARLRDVTAVAAVLVVTVALVALVVFVRHEDEHAVLPVLDPVAVDSDAEPTPVGEPVEVPADGVEFIEHSGAYSLRVGPGWDAADVPHGIGWYTGRGSRRFRDNVMSIVEDLPHPVALDDYVRLRVANSERSSIAYDEVARRSVVLADGNGATVIDYRSEQGGNEFAHRVGIAVRGRVAVSVTFTTETGRFDAEVDAVTPYLTSVQVR